jgi:hypothetical protein
MPKSTLSLFTSICYERSAGAFGEGIGDKSQLTISSAKPRAEKQPAGRRHFDDAVTDAEEAWKRESHTMRRLLQYG